MNFRSLSLPSPPDRSPLANWMLQVARSIVNVIDQPHIEVTNIIPENPIDGDIFFADGTHWNPGSGRGIYVRDATLGPGYRFLG